MAEFIEGDEINTKLNKIITDASTELIFISPYIKLHERIKEKLNSVKEDDKLKIIIVFGKNEGHIKDSFDKSSFEFLMEFPNIEIRYEKRLHAKYYSNEYDGLLSSMNLYDFSQNNNIEFGIWMPNSVLGDISKFVAGGGVDKSSREYFDKVIKNSVLKFKKVPQYDKGKLGFGKKYVTSENTTDELTKEFSFIPKTKTSNSKKKVEVNVKSKMGYCIRTKTRIPFDIHMPYSEKSYESWSKYKNKDYKEKYCHFTGEVSDGKTTFKKPILTENWKKAHS